MVRSASSRLSEVASSYAEEPASAGNQALLALMQALGATMDVAKHYWEVLGSCCSRLCCAAAAFQACCSVAMPAQGIACMTRSFEQAYASAQCRCESSNSCTRASARVQAIT